jgi:general secretion pathway protein D
MRVDRNRSRSRAHRSVPIAVCVAVVALLGACNVLTATDEDARPPGVFDKVRSIDLLPRFPAQSENAKNPVDRRRQAVYGGTEVPTLAATGGEAPATATGEGYELNFDNTPITTVAKVVLGDILGVGYTIDPRVQGTISLASGRPVPKSDILYVLENALRISAVVLVRDTTGYRLVPLGDAVGSGNIDKSAQAEPGFGITVVPLQYISVQALMKLLDSFATKPGMVRADASRNLILVQGSGAERRAAVETILSFDADWMRGQSVGVYPVRNSTPEPIIAELEKIMDSGEGGLSQNLIKVQAINRMNAILVVTRKPQLLKTASTWIERLDNSDSGSTGVRVYRVRYGEARQLARVLNEVFVGSASTGLDSATNQIAPGAGLTMSTSNDRSAFGTQPSSTSTSVRQQLSASSFEQRGGLASSIGGSTSPSGAVGGGAADATRGTSPGASGTPLLPGVRITADTANNSLLIYASQENYKVIERTLQQLDRPQLQVAIDATIAEVTLNENLNYGVQFFLTSHNLGLKTDRGSLLNTNGGAPGINAAGIAGAFINRAFPGFNFLLGSEAQPSVILDALHNVTDVKVLSTPSVVVMDNQVAVLLVGDQVPVSTGSATVLTTNNTIVNTIDYRNTGIILRVVPRINVNGNVLLDVEQEISNVSNAGAAANTATTLTPTVSQRKVKSSIAVATGQTVLLAGLISERQERQRPGIPLLDQIPGIGDAFSHTTKTTQRTELIMFIRPQIIRNSVDAHFVAEELRSKLTGRIGAAPAEVVSPKPR